MSEISRFEDLDQGIEAMLSAVVLAGAEDAEITELLRIASHLRELPRPEFKARLKTELEWVAASRPLSPARPGQSAETADIMPTLFGRGYGTYPVRRVNFAASAAIHAFAMVLVVCLGVLALRHKPKPVEVASHYITLSEYVPPAGSSEPHGGGGGGDHDKANASQGTLPKPAADQLVPPVVVVHNADPKLPEEPTIIAPDLHVTQSSQFGDPLSRLMIPSNGTGVRGGIGAGNGTGIGPDNGSGYGPGEGGNFGGQIYSLGGGISAPRVIYDPDPEYSQEARETKHEGTVVLWAVIGPDGRPRNLRVARPLGMGLDEKAIQAVTTWRFDPATKDGHPVAVAIEIYVSFHLY